MEHERSKSKEMLVEEAKCRYCGRKGHGAAPVIGRKKEVCPAYDKTCNACGGIGHFSKTKACRKKVALVEMVKQCEISGMGKESKANTVESNGDDAAAVNEVEAVRDTLGTKVKLSRNRPVPHMVDVGGELVVSVPREHPKLRVQMVVDAQFYKKHGLNLRLRRSCMTKQGKLLETPKVELLCDTGAQVSCVNVRRLKSLGIQLEDLLQPEVTVGCANETSADVIGVFFGTVMAMDMERAEKVQVKVMFYVLKRLGEGALYGGYESISERGRV